MGNCIARTDIFPGDTNITFVLSSADGIKSSFSLSFFRNSLESNPQYVLTFGALENSKLIIRKQDELTGKTVQERHLAALPVTRGCVKYCLDVHGRNLLLVDLGIPKVVGVYSSSDLQFMTQYAGRGSSGTIVIASAPRRSLMQLPSVDFAQPTVQSSLSREFSKPRLPEWALWLIIIGSAMVLVLVALLVGWMIMKRASRSNETKKARQPISRSKSRRKRW